MALDTPRKTERSGIRPNPAARALNALENTFEEAGLRTRRRAGGKLRVWDPDVGGRFSDIDCKKMSRAWWFTIDGAGWLRVDTTFKAPEEIRKRWDAQRKKGLAVVTDLGVAHTTLMMQSARLFSGDFGPPDESLERLSVQEPVDLNSAVGVLRAIRAKFPSDAEAADWCVRGLPAQVMEKLES
jgi:hypothetical protein